MLSYRFYSRHPALVLVDTTVIARAPKRQLVAGLGDALATWFEARTVLQSHVNNQLGASPQHRERLWQSFATTSC